MDSHEVLHFIEGEEVPSLSGRTFPTVNPATGEVFAEVAFGEVEDVDRAVAAAARSFNEGVWADLAAAERGRRLRGAGALIRERVDRIAHDESRDSGKPLSYARADVIAAADLLDYAATLPEHPRGAVYAKEQGYLAYSVREPYGVVGAISPWNFPFLLAVWKTAFALAVGNSVVLKVSEQAPVTASEYARICHEAGVPAGVLNLVHGDGPTTGAALVAHPGVPKLTFTGSTEVGRTILGVAARHVKSCHMELGGKTANIVFSDCDLEKAISGSLFTSFFNSGQICTTGSRLLIDERIAGEFLDEFVARARRLKVGDPLCEDTQMGPLVSARQLQRVRSYIEKGVAAGAQLVLGENEPVVPDCRGGYFVGPTIFDGVTTTMEIAQEEIFGPVLSVFSFESDDAAVAIANSVNYGLAVTMWTNALDRALSLVSRLDAGIIWTNCPHHLQWNVPYEGHKQSGLGEDLGSEAISEFTQLKVNYLNFSPDKVVW